MNKLILICMVNILISFGVVADSCKVEEGYQVGFFNGVATTIEQALNGNDRIEETLGISQYQGESVDYQLFYNDSYIEANGLNVLADFAETFAQRTQELEQTEFDRWEAFWDIVNGRQDSSIIQKISAVFSWFKGMVADLVSYAANVIIREFLEALAGLVYAPDTEDTRMKHRLFNNSNVWGGKKLIYIAHSQGNLWVNESYKYITEELGYDESNIHVIHIAPASPTLSPNSDYILSSSDIVINGLNLTGIGTVPPPNTVIAPSKSDITGHGLSEIYLAHPDSIAKIQASASSAFESLLKPEIEDYLFKITYSYTPTFVEHHDLPEIMFVDNDYDWEKRATIDFGDGVPYVDEPYVHQVPDQYEFFIKPREGVKTLPFIHDKTGRHYHVVKINQCSNIPNDAPFVLSEKSKQTTDVISSLSPPLDAKMSITVRDRYGVLVQSHEVDSTDVWSKGWRYQGVFLDIQAVNPHTEKERSFIEVNELETKYELYSNSVVTVTSS